MLFTNVFAVSMSGALSVHFGTLFDRNLQIIPELKSFLLDGLHSGEQKDVADCGAVGQEHPFFVAFSHKKAEIISFYTF